VVICRFTPYFKPDIQDHHIGSYPAEGPRLTVFEKNVQRKVFGYKKAEVTGEQRKLCNREFHNPY
jgi:hypothetical protein